MDAFFGLNCQDMVYVVSPLVAFAIGVAVAKTDRYAKLRMQLPEAVQAPLRTPLINGLVFALVSLLLIWVGVQVKGKADAGFAPTYEALLPPEMYGYGGLMPSTGAAMTAGNVAPPPMAEVGFDNKFPPP